VICGLSEASAGGERGGFGRATGRIGHCCCTGIRKFASRRIEILAELRVGVQAGDRSRRD